MTISATTQGLRPGVCTSSNRPATPFEGQMIYETDTDMVAVWNGSAWRYIAATTPTNGTVLQVQSTTLTTSIAAGVSSTPADISGMSVSITPKSTTSKILVTAAINVAQQYTVNELALRMMRDSTAIFIGDAAGSRPRVSGFVMGAVDAYAFRPFSFTHLDSPSSTSSLTYKIQWWSTNGSGNAYLNRTQDDADNQFRPRSASSITVMEIAG